MKIKLFILGLSLGATILGGCNDDFTTVGSGIQPGGDRPKVVVDSFQMTASTILTDSVYARTAAGSLGEIYDLNYGNLKSDYICQFYCPEGYKFSHVPVDGKIDSVEFKIIYNSWTGDSLTPMKVKLYEVTEQLPRDFYTNIDPEKYCNMNRSFGEQPYTAFDRSVPDSVRYEKDINGNYLYQPSVTVRMPKECGQRLYDETVNNPSSFSNQQAFNQFFPGVYVTTSFGSGNVLNVDYTRILIYYKTAITGSAGQDSIIQTSEAFNVTSEVIQLNRFKNTEMGQLLEPNDSITYIKSPAGVYTQLVLPSQEIAPIIQGRIVNTLSLTLKAIPQEMSEFSLDVPPYLLVLPTDSVNQFFLNNDLENNKTSFLGKYISNSRSYVFGNISGMLMDHIEKAPDKDLVISVIPVERIYKDETNYYGQKTGNTITTAINNYLKPAGTKLRKDKESMTVRIVTTQYQDR